MILFVGPITDLTVILYKIQLNSNTNIIYNLVVLTAIFFFQLEQSTKLNRLLFL